jgi:hypothetical protein
MFVRPTRLVSKSITLGATTVGMALSSSAFAEDATCVGKCEPVSILSPASGFHTTDTTPVFLGMADPGALVEVSLANEVGWVVANDRGNWRWTPEHPLAEGDQRFEARVGDDVQSVTVCVDTKAPTVAILSPTEGAIRSDAQLTIRGEVEPGANLVVTLDGVTLPVIVDSFGQWLHVSARNVPDGDHVLMARATDAAGNTTETVVGLTIDGTAPAVRIMSPADGATFKTAPDSVGGHAEPGTKLSVTGPGVDLDITVPSSGMWRVAVPPVGEGQHHYTVEATDALGWTAEDAVTIFVDQTPPGLAMTQSLDEGPVAAAVFAGTADPGTLVTVEVDGAMIGTDNVTADGRWKVDATGRLADGMHLARIIAMDRVHNITQMEAMFVTDTTAPALTVDRMTDDDVVVLAGTAEAFASIDVRDEGDLIGMAAADAQGAWSVSLADLEAGTHNLVITATDLAGNITKTRHTVDISAPVHGDAGCAGGPLASGLPMMLGLLGLLGLRTRRS